MNPLERNKQTATAFYDPMFSQHEPREAVARHAGAQYIQHNPHVGEGNRPLSAISNAWPASIPGSR